MLPNLEKSEQIFRNLNEIPFFYIVFIILAALLLNSIVKRALPAVANILPPRFNHYLLPMIPVVRLLVSLSAFFLLIPTVVRPSVQNFIAIFGSIGLTLGFAFKDFASSIIAGIVAIYEKPYRVGDRVKINDIYGEVESINLRSLRITTPDDDIVTIPHSCIWNGSVHNANDGEREQQCVANFYLAPEHDASKASQLLYDVAISSPYTQFSRPVKVVLAEQPWGTHYKIRAYPVDGRSEFAYISNLTIRGKKALSDAGIDFTNMLPFRPEMNK